MALVELARSSRVWEALTVSSPLACSGILCTIWYEVCEAGMVSLSVSCLSEESVLFLLGVFLKLEAKWIVVGHLSQFTNRPGLGLGPRSRPRPTPVPSPRPRIRPRVKPRPPLEFAIMADYDPGRHRSIAVFNSQSKTDDVNGGEARVGDT